MGTGLGALSWVYPGFPTLFWGGVFVNDLMERPWELVENAQRFPRCGGRVLCVHGAVSFHRAHLLRQDRRVLGLQSTRE